MDAKSLFFAVTAALSLMMGGGCQSSPHATEGTLLGGLTGAGIGALIGHATGHTGAGAAIGAGVGAVSGAAVGSTLDDIEARNRAEIQARMGREIAGRVTMDDVVNMTHSGVAEEIMVNHIQRHGVAAPLTANDLIFLKDQGVSPRVVEAMQFVSTRPPGAPGTVIVQEHYVAPPSYGVYVGPGYRPHRYGYYYGGYWR